MLEISRGESFAVAIQLAESKYATRSWEEMQMIESRFLASGDRCFVNDVNVHHIYDSDAATGDFRPDDTEKETGYWVTAEPSFMDFSLFIKIEAHIVLKDTLERYLSFSSVSQEGFKDFEMEDAQTGVAIVESEESKKFIAGDYVVEVHKYIEDNTFTEGYKLEIMPLGLVTVIDSSL